MEAAARDMLQQKLAEQDTKTANAARFNHIPTIIPFAQSNSSEHDIVGNG